MKKFLSKSKISLAAATIVLPLSIQAATLDDVVKSVNAVYDLIARTVNATVTTVAGMVYEQNPNVPGTMATNISQQDAMQTTKGRYTNISNELVKQSLVNDEKPAPIVINDTGSKNNKIELKPSSTLELANLPASDYLAPGGSAVAKLFPGLQPKLPGVDTGNANFNATSLLEPTVYSDTQISQAYNFIQYLGRLDEPLMDGAMAWDKLTAEQKEDLQKTTAGQEYKVALRSLIANRSVALDNLYYLMAQRIPQAGLGTKAGMTQANASPLEVEKHMATRRADNATWYTNMESAAPATVAREQLYVMAEIEKMLFQIHLDNQRVLATLSTMELQNATQQKLQFKQVEEKAAASIGVSTSSSPNADDIGKEFGIETPDESDIDESQLSDEERAALEKRRQEQ